MPDLFTVIIFAFAVWRLCNLLINEEGLLGILIRIRLLIGIQYINITEKNNSFLNFQEIWDIYKLNADETLLQANYPHELARLFSCINCLSIWISAFFSIFIAENLLSFLILTLAISGLAILIEYLKGSYEK